ncbi:MAG: M23 family metallopeptidase [Ignavibacteriales bacterium]|nr:M23 family metallopeptidase [Ignavibacteriales bacterium]
MVWATALIGFVASFSGVNHFPGTNLDSSVNGPHVSRVDEIYAPFDTLRTDLQDYIWPTNASTNITSSFADYRRTHLHEGIDISTNNQKGYPVYAARDGYVSRIFISRRGYGKMLYVRHHDGYVTMYAHLQRFFDPIEKYAKQLQKQNRRYSLEVDIDTSLFRVSKGDLIAYTGDTGIGSAHLHFEVRDSSSNPINPFLLPQISAAIRDVVPPVYHMVAFTPLSGSAKIQRRHKTWVSDAQMESSGNFVLPHPIQLSGSIGVSVSVTDQADVLRYRTGAYRFEMYIDGQPVFSSVKKYILEREAHQVMAYYDRNLLRARKGRFEKLYIESGNRLSFYNRLPEGAGSIEASDLEPGDHELKIITWDLAGNESTLTAILTVSKPQTR